MQLLCIMIGRITMHNFQAVLHTPAYLRTTLIPPTLMVARISTWLLCYQYHFGPDNVYK